MFSGLNLAFFSVSKLRLEIESSKNNVNAKKILTLRQDPNFLLTTILWGNVGINVLLTLLSDSVLAGVYSFLFSTVIITLVGEIIPQAYFSRHAIKSAALLSPVLRIYQMLLFPVAKPTAMILDKWLGKERNYRIEKNHLKEYAPDDARMIDSERQLRGQINNQLIFGGTFASFCFKPQLSCQGDHLGIFSQNQTRDRLKPPLFGNAETFFQQPNTNAFALPLVPHKHGKFTAGLTGIIDNAGNPKQFF